MKREIKFRMWRDGRMQSVHTMYSRVSHFQHDSNPSLHPQDFNNVSDDQVIMQYIGLADKNGKEIYEDDVVKYSVLKRFCKTVGCEEENKAGVDKFCTNCGANIELSDFITTAKVVYNKAAFGYQTEDIENETYQHWPVYANEIYIEWVEVIGDIYQNPELLTQLSTRQ